MFATRTCFYFFCLKIGLLTVIYCLVPSEAQRCSTHRNALNTFSIFSPRYAGVSEDTVASSSHNSFFTALRSSRVICWRRSIVIRNSTKHRFTRLWLTGRKNKQKKRKKGKRLRFGSSRYIAILSIEKRTQKKVKIRKEGKRETNCVSNRRLSETAQSEHR